MSIRLKIAVILALGVVLPLAISVYFWIGALRETLGDSFRLSMLVRPGELSALMAKRAEAGVTRRSKTVTSMLKSAVKELDRDLDRLECVATAAQDGAPCRKAVEEFRSFHGENINGLRVSIPGQRPWGWHDPDGREGYDVARKLRSWPETRDIPIIMLTALDAIEEKVQGLDAGADDFLTKPANPDELYSRARNLLRAKFYHQQVVEKNALLEQILTRWQSPDVVKQILDDSSRLKPGGVRSTVSVLFADLSGFTPFSETREPEEVMEVLNHAFSRLTEIVFKHHGTLDKFIGDCVMAFYGAPIPAGNDAVNAVRSALEMRRVFNELKAQWGDAGPQLGLAIGINSGEAIVGNVGSDRRLEYTVIGDTVNVAARLQDQAGAGQILIGEDTHRKAVTEMGERLITRERPAVSLKGREKPLRVHEVVREMRQS
jgi:class 3 adenylate cyclase